MQPLNHPADLAFRNGAEHMKAKILDKLLGMKGKALGKDRALLSELIQMIEKMEVTL